MINPLGYGGISMGINDKNDNVIVPSKEGGVLRYSFAKEAPQDALQCQKEGINNLCMESYNAGSGQSTCQGDR